MVLGRWAGDGLIEVVPVVDDRVVEIGDITGWPVVTLDGYPRYVSRYPWLREAPERVLHLVPSDGGPRVLGGQPGSAPAAAGAGLLSRVWRCQRRDCPTFGDRRGNAQAVPRMRAGVPTCPRHEEPLTNAGVKPPSVTMVLIVDGVIRERFVVRMGRPLTVGRSPDDPTGLMIGAHVSGEAAQMISRNHVRFELREDGLLVTDTSTNGTVVASRTSPFSAADEVRLSGGAPYPLKPWDTVEVHHGVLLSRAGMARSASQGGLSVMQDAPTISMRPPDLYG